jgi:hypothetical protein
LCRSNEKINFVSCDSVIQHYSSPDPLASLMFQRNVLPPCSGWKIKVSKQEQPVLAASFVLVAGVAYFLIRRWRQYVPPKRRWISTILQNVISHNIVTLSHLWEPEIQHSNIPTSTESEAVIILHCNWISCFHWMVITDKKGSLEGWLSQMKSVE